MKNIQLTFLTKKGDDAYHQIKLKGKGQSWRDRRISNSVASDSVVQESPLIVRIDVKIEWLAVQVGLDVQTEAALSQYGAKKDIDYTMEVK
jgi:hypothetical protein